MSIIRDSSLKDEGRQRIEWVAMHMPVLNQIGERFEREKPFQGMKIALSIHLEAKTAYLVKTLARSGAEMHVTGSNPLSTQDCVCAALAADGIDVNAINGSDRQQTVELWKKTLSCHPDIVIDDGADLVHLLLTDCRESADRLLGGCEERLGVLGCTAGRTRAKLRFPVMAINDARCKSYIDKHTAPANPPWMRFMRTTNRSVNGKTVVIAGLRVLRPGIANIAKGPRAARHHNGDRSVKSILAISGRL
jgi:adenosylhomocysteinase